MIEKKLPGKQERKHALDGEITSAPERDSPAAQPPSRLGKKPITAYVEKAAHKQLRMLGLELDKSTQSMMIEALNDYFELHGLERMG